MLELTSVSKSFGETIALDNVSLRAQAGEIVAIAGENGAGKTTLMRVIAGELAPDRGAVRIGGNVGFVHQHFMLVGDFTIAENLALTWRDRLRFRRPRDVAREAERVIAETGLEMSDVSRRVDTLSVGEKSKLELIKAIARRPEVLILDEPTSVLTPLESAELFTVIRRIAASGTTVLFISHKIGEVLHIADRVMVMRHGRVVADAAAGGMTAQQLANAMIDLAPIAVAEPLSRSVVPSRRPSAALECRAISTDRLDNINIEVAAGEIVAVIGVAGNGQADLAAALRGLLRPACGTISIGGNPASSGELLRTRMVGHVPEDRTRDGLVAQMSIAENIALAANRWNRADAIHRAAQLITLYSIRARGPLQNAGSLSGGNQQKVILARELDRRPEVIVAAEPARGLDFEATRFVHEQLRQAAAAGAAILLITSDLDEAFALATAVYAIYRGRTSQRLSPSDAAARAASLMAGVA